MHLLGRVCLHAVWGKVSLEMMAGQDFALVVHVLL